MEPGRWLSIGAVIMCLASIALGGHAKAFHFFLHFRVETRCSWPLQENEERIHCTIAVLRQRLLFTVIDVLGGG